MHAIRIGHTVAQEKCNEPGEKVYRNFNNQSLGERIAGHRHAGAWSGGRGSSHRGGRRLHHGLHIGLGFFALLFVLWRTGYRLYEGFPPTLGESEWQRQLAWWMHRILLGVLFLQVLTGPLYLFTEGEGMDVFGWFTFYLPLSALSILHEPVEWLHKFGGNYLIPALILVHFAGAVRHFMNGDRASPADM